MYLKAVILLSVISFAHSCPYIAEPSSLNVSQGTTAQFSVIVCRDSLSTIVWNVDNFLYLNGNNINGVSVSQEILNRNSIRSNLFLSTRSRKFASIRSTVYAPQSFTSDTVRLRVQGLLNAVNDLSYDRINQKMSWVPPFTLSGVPILHYRININSDTNNFPVIMTNSTTLYLNGTPSGNYTATIRAVNAVGEGQAASLEYTHIGVGITSGMLSNASSPMSSIASSLDMVSSTKRLTSVRSTSTMTSNGVLITITASSSKAHYPSTTHHLSKAHSTVISNTMHTTTSAANGVSKTAHKALTTSSSKTHYSSTAYYPSKPHSTVNRNTVPTTSSAANSSSSAFIISGAVGVILLIIIMIIVTLLIILAIKKRKGRTNVEATMYSTAEATPTYDEIADKPTTPIYATPMETDTNISVHPNTAYQGSTVNKDIIDVHDNTAYGQITM